LGRKQEPNTVTLPPARLVPDLARVEDGEGIHLFCPCLAGLPVESATTTALLPIHDANGQLLEATGAAKAIPSHIFACVLATDPFRRLPETLRFLADAGVKGIANFPSVTAIDGTMRATLDELGIGFEQELRLVRLANELGFRTAGVVATEVEASAMLSVGAGLLLFPAIAPPRAEHDQRRYRLTM
jgi:predicted TIM-barrel enzyme